MMKKMMFVMVLTVLAFSLFGAEIGSAAADGKRNLSLEEMLRYALEDEYMALAEYEALMKKFNLDRPYSNIAESEKTHITYLEELYKAHNIQIPRVETKKHLVIPSSPGDAAALGVEAEIKNIAMYEQFLKQDLPDDVRDVFTRLMRASENHKRAFERQLEAGGGGRGRDRS